MNPAQQQNEKLGLSFSASTLAKTGNSPPKCLCLTAVVLEALNTQHLSKEQSIWVMPEGIQCTGCLSGVQCRAFPHLSLASLLIAQPQLHCSG